MKHAMKVIHSAKQKDDWKMEKWVKQTKSCVENDIEKNIMFPKNEDLIKKSIQ